MPRIQGFAHLLTAAALALSVCACASGPRESALPRPAPPTDHSAASDATPRAEAVEPIADVPVAPDGAEAAPAAAAQAAEAASDEGATQAQSDATAEQTAEDAAALAPPFRPVWWHDAPRLVAGRVHVCASAQAETLAEANRMAVEAGLSQLGEELRARGSDKVGALLADFRTEAVAADLAGPTLWRGFVELSAPLIAAD